MPVDILLHYMGILCLKKNPYNMERDRVLWSDLKFDDLLEVFLS